MASPSKEVLERRDRIKALLEEAAQLTQGINDRVVEVSELLAEDHVGQNGD